MIVFTASDSSEREEKNLGPAYWFDVPSSSLFLWGQREGWHREGRTGQKIKES